MLRDTKKGLISQLVLVAVVVVVVVVGGGRNACSAQAVWAGLFALTKFRKIHPGLKKGCISAA